MNGNQIINNRDVSSRFSLLPGLVLAADIDLGMARPCDYARNIVENLYLRHHLDIQCPFTVRAEVVPDFGPLLTEQVARTTSNREQQRCLKNVAQEYACQIYRISGLRNHEVLVRLAVELAFNTLYLSKVSEVLKGRWGGYWHLDPAADRIRRDVNMPDEFLPVASRNLMWLIHATARFGEAELPEDNLVESYAGLPATPAWSCDPLRPPVQALRAAAHVINGTLHDKRLKIMALDLGVNIGAQALATFCPRAAVYSESMLLPEVSNEKSSSTFDAVVLGAPGAVSWDFTRMVRSLERPLTRWDVAPFAARPTTELPPLLRERTDRAIASVRPGGVLVVVGDIGSSSVPIADALVSWTGRFIRVRVGGNMRPVAFRYATSSQDIYGGLPATGRLVSAWRRNW